MKARETSILNVKNAKTASYTYIGRGHPLGNPFKLNKKGTNRAEVICQYFQHLTKDRSLMNLLVAVQGKVLGCYCAPLDCHGDVVGALADCFVVKGQRIKWLEDDIPPLDLHHLSKNRPEGEFICYVGDGDNKQWFAHPNAYEAIVGAVEKWRAAKSD